MKIHNAITFATIKHNGQVRKGTDVPYIVHPIEVMQILLSHGASEDVVVAGILHDVLEDTNATIAEIESLFGNFVAGLVASESEYKSKTWEERKQSTIWHLHKASKDVQTICLADKLSNLRSIYADYLLVGDVVWQRFNRGKEALSWYYNEIAKATEKDLGTTDMWKAYNQLLKVVFS